MVKKKIPARCQLSSDTTYPETESDSTGKGLTPQDHPPLQGPVTSPS